MGLGELGLICGLCAVLVFLPLVFMLVHNRRK
jgi:hypothetical protein